MLVIEKGRTLPLHEPSFHLRGSFLLLVHPKLLESIVTAVGKNKNKFILPM